MKVRPADATMANLVTLLGGTNVQSSAPEVRDIIERHVADAVTFPWGSLVLFGIDKVTKYHMEAPLYVTTFAFVFNKDKYNQMSPRQKKAIDDNCNTEAAGRVGGPWGEFEDAGVAKVKAEPGQSRLFAHPGADRGVEEGERTAGQQLGRRRQESRRRSGRGAEGPARRPRPNTTRWRSKPRAVTPRDPGTAAAGFSRRRFR